MNNTTNQKECKSEVLGRNSQITICKEKTFDKHTQVNLLEKPQGTTIKKILKTIPENLTKETNSKSYFNHHELLNAKSLFINVVSSGNYCMEEANHVIRYIHNSSYSKNGINKFNNRYKVPYIGRLKPVKRTKDEEFNFSQTKMERSMKYYCCNDIYYDVDIANCAFVIIEFLFNIHNLKCPYLHKYNCNREKQLRNLMIKMDCSRDMAKDYLVAMLYADNNTTSSMAKNPFVTSDIRNCIIEVKKYRKKLLKLYTQFVQYSKNNDKKIKWSCDYCYREFDTRNGKNYHEIKYCRKNNNRFFEFKSFCTYCNREFDTKNGARYHETFYCRKNPKVKKKYYNYSSKK